MAQWGRNDQSVTANSTTTRETSNGAPIGTYTLIKGDQVAGVPHSTNAHFGNTSPGSRAGDDVAMFNNATPGAFISGQAVGIFGVSETEMANNVANHSKERPAHAGWVVRRAGTGPVISIQFGNSVVTSGYANTDTLTFVSPEAGGNGAATIQTSPAGVVTGVTITNKGFGFTLTTLNGANVVYTGSGTGMQWAATVGGRAGRVQTETLVAMSSLGAQTGVSAPALVNDAAGGTDDPYYPGV